MPETADKRCMHKQAVSLSVTLQNLTVDHKDYISLLRKLRAVPGVKKVFIRSGIRFDYCMADSDDTFYQNSVIIT